MTSDFRLLMLGAMYENGGNTSHRFLDGHPEMFVYPFESQPGTKYVNDNLTSMFPVKYRWPTFALEATPEQDYKAIIDEECKVRARTPQVSKFRHMPFAFSDDDRLSLYLDHIKKTGRSRANNIAAFYKSTFEAWKDFRRTGKESVHVGYSPIITVDAEKILTDLPTSHFLHIVRNPWSAYADTKKRPVPMALSAYMLAWNLNQYFALLLRDKYPGRFHIVRTEDVMEDSKAALGPVCQKMGLEVADSLSQVTWNGIELEEIYPWGTIRKASTKVNIDTANELSKEEKEQIRTLTWQYLDIFEYSSLDQKVLART
jgi:Sulfotransferase family